jgi:hypothetical protein
LVRGRSTDSEPRNRPGPELLVTVTKLRHCARTAGSRVRCAAGRSFGRICDRPRRRFWAGHGFWFSRNRAPRWSHRYGCSTAGPSAAVSASPGSSNRRHFCKPSGPGPPLFRPRCRLPTILCSGAGSVHPEADNGGRLSAVKRAHRRTVTAHARGRAILLRWGGPRDRTPAADPLLQLFVRRAIGCGDRRGGLAQVLEGTPRVRCTGPGARDGLAPGRRPLGDHGRDGSRPRRANLTDQRGDVLAGGGPATPGPPPLPPQTVAEPPAHRRADLGLQALDGSPDTAVPTPPRPPPAGMGVSPSTAFIVAIAPIGNGAFRDDQAALPEFGGDLRDPAVLEGAEVADQGHDLQTELGRRPGEGRLGFRSVRLMKPRARRRNAAGDAADQPPDAIQGGEGAKVVGSEPERVSPVGAAGKQGREGQRGSGTGTGSRAQDRSSSAIPLSLLRTDEPLKLSLPA